MKNIFEKSKSEKKIISIWVYDDNDSFFSGYVKDYNEEFVFIQHFTKYGKPDGIIVQRIDLIESIDFEDDYSKCMEYVIANHSELDNEPEINVSVNNFENWQFEVLDQQMGNEEVIVSIQMENDNFYHGFVKWLDEESLVLHTVYKDGMDEGKSMYKLEDIKSIRINDLENRKRLMLYKWRKSK